MTNKCKCKCRKDVMVVVIDSSTPYGGTFCDFLKGLSPEKRCKYNYVPFYANTSTEAWVDKLKCKLQQLCKKNCKKPNVLSTLFDTNLEMLLARVQACVNCIYLTHSTSEVNPIFKCHKTLPAGKLKERTNAVYENDDSYKRFLLGYTKQKKARDIMVNSSPYNNSVLYNMGTSIVQLVGFDMIDTNADNADLFIVDATGLTNDDFYNLAKSKEDIKEAPTLCDQSLSQFFMMNKGISDVFSCNNQLLVGIDGNYGLRYLSVFSNESTQNTKAKDIINFCTPESFSMAGITFSSPFPCVVINEDGDGDFPTFLGQGTITQTGSTAFDFNRTS